MQKGNHIPLVAMIDQINHSDKVELDAMEQAIILRYRELFPEWEIISLSLPKNNMEERHRILKSAIQMLG